MLSRPLDQSETPARLTTRPGAGPAPDYYARRPSAAGCAPQSCGPAGRHACACVRVCECGERGPRGVRVCGGSRAMAAPA